MYCGVRCREIVERGEIDDLSIAIAARLQQQVVESIASGNFDYLKRFPDSKTAQRLSQTEAGQARKMSTVNSPRNISRMTVAEGVEAWLKTQCSGKAKSTAANYTSRAQHVLAAFGERCLADVTAQELQQFRNGLVRSKHNPEGLSPKTVNDVLTVIRGVWEDARLNDITNTNRAGGVKNHDLAERSAADPFTWDEMQRLLWADPVHLATARMVVCNCWVGLSRSELIALAAEDVDLEKKKLKVRRAFVHGEHKSPKEKTRAREIDLLQPAIELMREILLGMADTLAEEIEVTALDNLSISTESVRLLFRNPNTSGPWSQSALDRWFKAHTKKAGVRYRGINQCRHTFASRALSHYAPREWVIHQLGHGDDQMLRKHYARWMPSETGDVSVHLDAINKTMTSNWTQVSQA